MKLIDNAFKFQNKCGDTKHSVKIEILNQNNSPCIMISDNGSGIQDADLDKIFDLFVRISDKSKSGGIGLFIVKLALDKLGGSIEAKSDQTARNTTFKVTFPQ